MTRFYVDMSVSEPSPSAVVNLVRIRRVIRVWLSRFSTVFYNNESCSRDKRSFTLILCRRSVRHNCILFFIRTCIYSFTSPKDVVHVKSCVNLILRVKSTAFLLWFHWVFDYTKLPWLRLRLRLHNCILPSFILKA